MMHGTMSLKKKVYSIVKVITARWTRWAGHVARMGDKSNSFAEETGVRVSM